MRERARVVVLNSPNNPTGSALPAGRGRADPGRDRRPGRLRRGLPGVRRPDGGAAARPEPRLVVLRTFSKALGMAGLRFGLALAHPAVAREIAKGKLPYNVNLITLAAAAVALRQRRSSRRAPGDRGAPATRLPAAAPRIPGLTVYPSGGQLRADPLPAAAGAGALPAAAGGARDPGARRLGSAELAECLRISIGTPEDMDAVLAALQAILGGDGMSRVGELRRTTKETRSSSGSPSTAGARPRCGPASGSSTTCSRRWRGTRCWISPSRRRATSTWTATTPWRTSASPSARPSPRRWATVPASGATATALVPLDEALVRAVVDVSGRPYPALRHRIPKWQMLGDYDVFLTPEFFRALVLNAGLTVHLDLVRGDNPHHIVEAAFKAFARALDDATRSTRGSGVPSTKGAL